MKSIYTILKKIKNLLPYLGLIAVYFFFINIEAKKEKNNQNKFEKVYKMPKTEFKLKNEQLRINIPVIPYKE